AAIVGSLTVLPALLHKLGPKVEKGRIPFLGRHRGEAVFWNAIVRRVLARPALSLALSAGFLAVCALPVFTMHTKLPSLTDLPHSLKIIGTYQQLQAPSPGPQTP